MSDLEVRNQLLWVFFEKIKALDGRIYIVKYIEFYLSNYI